MSDLFIERLSRTEKRDTMLLQLGGSAWKFALAALYLTDSRYLPDDAKKHGCVFGYCDANGKQCPRSEATHVGWTVKA